MDDASNTSSTPIPATPSSPSNNNSMFMVLGVVLVVFLIIIGVIFVSRRRMARQTMQQTYPPGYQNQGQPAAGQGTSGTSMNQNPPTNNTDQLIQSIDTKMGNLGSSVNTMNGDNNPQVPSDQ